jgi:hypothetical protein
MTCPHGRMPGGICAACDREHDPFARMQIEGRDLTPADVGGIVVYVPRNEPGVITSWNEHYVFVRTHHLQHHGSATVPRDLRWATPDDVRGRWMDPTPPPEGNVRCERCQGTGTATGARHFHMADGNHQWQTSWSCDRCKGWGHISNEYVAALAEGERLREDRRARNVSLREEAARLGISPVELSRREHPPNERKWKP